MSRASYFNSEDSTGFTTENRLPACDLSEGLTAKTTVKSGASKKISIYLDLSDKILRNVTIFNLISGKIKT